MPFQVELKFIRFLKRFIMLLRFMLTMPKNKEEWKVHGNVFSEFTNRALFKLMSEGHMEGLKSPVKIGKEANIFTAETKDHTLIIAKIYRLESCNFNKMYSYLAADNRFKNLKKGKRNVVFAWAGREYRNLLLAREVIKVPTPIAIKDNILLMEFIGHKEPAPALNKSEVKNPKKFFDQVIETMRKLYQIGLVHGDLSEYNILNHDQSPVFIDFSQAVTLDSPNSKEWLERDIENICRYFSRAIAVDVDMVKKKIMKKK
jgi:RIO kinase 1